nr:hypothetical protein [bacterium]
ARRYPWVEGSRRLRREDAGILMGAARIYSAFAPYPHTVVEHVDYVQTADVVYTTHLDYPVYKATRSSHTSWVFAPATFAPTVAIPTTPTGVASAPNSTGYIATNYRYKITAVGGPTEQESRPSAQLQLTNDLTLAGNFNTLTLPAKPAGVDRYIIYKEMGGAYGYIGGTDGSTFVDGNPQIQPVLSDTPPLAQNPFDVAGNYPSVGTFHDQRLYLAGTRNIPNGVWGSQPADFENMDISRPSKPDDALSFALVAEKVNSVFQLASMEDLMLFTSNGVFAANGGGENEPMTPSSILPKRQNSRGGSRLDPIVMDDIAFYKPNKGTYPRTIGFQFEIDGYQSNNIAIFSPHFFKGFDIISWAYVEEPYSAIFAVRDDGIMLCFTWEAEQQVWGWTQMEIDGSVLEVSSITEGGYDRLYAVIERTINGVVRRFHERMALPHVDDIAAAVHLDCSVTQVYALARNTVDGLWHLEGALVSAYYDGYVSHNLLVTGGEVTLPNGYEATIATVGLRYYGEIETLPLVLNTKDGSGHVNQQNISRLVIRAVDTQGLTAGITGTEPEAIYERLDGELLPDTAQRDYTITPRGSWEPTSTLTIRQEEPMPAHITGLFVEPKVSNR